MKKFKFRLERILQYRAAVREQKKIELYQKNRKLAEENERLEMLEMEQTNNSLKEGRELSAGEVYLAGLYAGRLQEEIIAQKISIIEAENAVQIALNEYVEKSREAKALETLKEKKQLEHKYLLEKDQEKLNDEFNVQKGNSFNKN